MYKIKIETSQFLFHPEHTIKILWDTYLLILTLFLAYWVPFSLSFLEDTTEAMEFFEFLISLSFLFDILMNFNTSYYSKGALVTSRSKIFKNYLTGMFWVDIFSSFPYEWLSNPPLQNGSIKSPSYFGIMKLFRFIRMAKLLRLLKSRKIFYKIEDCILNEFISVIYAFMKLGIFLSIVAHWIACVFYYTSTVQSTSTEYTWVKIFLSSRSEDVEIYELYITSLYWAFTTMISVGYGDITPQNPYEMTVTVGCMTLSCIYFAYIIGNMSTLISKHLATEHRKSEIRVGTSRFMKKKSVPKETQRKVMAFIDNLMEDLSIYKLQDHEVLGLLSQPLRNEIFFLLYRDILKKCRIFTQYFCDDIIIGLTKALNMENYSPNDVVFYEKTHNRIMYFICSGVVNIMHESTGLIYKQLEKDEMFGEIGFFVGHSRTATAKCIDFTLLQTLDLNETVGYLNKGDNFINTLESLKDFCCKHNYSSLMICCFLCGCLGHVAKDCTVEKIQSGLEAVVANYKNRKTRIPRYGASLKEKKKCKPHQLYKRIIVPEKIFDKNTELQMKIKKFIKEQLLPINITTQNTKYSIIDKILEESDEESYD